VSGYAVVENPSAELWDSFLKEASPEGNFFQCFGYGEMVKTAYPRRKIVRLLISYGGKSIGIAQGTYPVYLGFGTTLHVNWGPIVCVETGENLQFVGSLVKEIEAYCRRKRIIQALFSVFGSWKLQEVFHKMNYSAGRKANEYVVDLEEGVEKLWMKIHHNKRRNIKKALGQGVEINQSHSNEDLKTFYSLLNASVKRQGFIPYPRPLFEAIWNNYNPELSKVFLANWKGRSVSGVFVVVQGKTVYALNAGSLVEGWEVRPNDIMHWKVMEWACANGYLKYNLGGVSEPPPTERSSSWGIWRWKREWNGNLERIEIFDKIILPKYKPILQARNFVYEGLRRLK
jgi:lipid II:glycine glycyltransferase (peptidoglycan interpeptide bridge formation enzyme)